MNTHSPVDRHESCGPIHSPRVALVLGGGAARGLAHIGVLEVFEREAIKLHSIVGTSMGGLVGALSATGLKARDIAEIARGFRFPRWFLPGALLDWRSLFAPTTGERELSLRFDPVCAMVINPTRARAKVTREDRTYYFCSRNCRDRFNRDPDAYLGRARLDLGGQT